MLAVELAEMVPIFLGVGGLMSLGMFAVQAISGHEGHDVAERQLLAQRWTDLLTASARAHDECLERERVLRERVDRLEDRVYTLGADDWPPK